MLPGGEALAIQSPATLNPSQNKEDTLAGRLKEVSSVLTQCDVLAGGSLTAIGFPPPPDNTKRPEPMGLAGKVLEIRNELLELRVKLETRKNEMQ